MNKKRMGRPPAAMEKLQANRDEILKRYQMGVGITRLAQDFGVSRPTMRTFIKKAKALGN